MKLQIYDNNPKEQQEIAKHFRSLGLAVTSFNRGETQVKLSGFKQYDFCIRYVSTSRDCGYYSTFIWEHYKGSIVSEMAFDNLRDALSWAVLAIVVIDVRWNNRLADLDCTR